MGKTTPNKPLVGKILTLGIACAAATALAPTASAASLDLGPAANYALVALGNGKTIGQNSGPLVGDELLGNGIGAHFSGGGGGKITGTLYYDNTVTGTNTFSQLNTPPTTSLVSTSLTASVLSAAQSVSDYAAGLSPTQTFATIDSTTTILAGGGLNVISLGSLHNAPLTLKGNANDVFVFNVTGSFDTNQPMKLIGVKAGNILFNLLGTSGNVFQTSGGDQPLYGTFLATHGGNFQFSNLGLSGELINTAGDVQFVSGTQMNFVPLAVAVPLPAAVWSGLAMLAALGLMRKLRKTKSPH